MLAISTMWNALEQPDGAAMFDGLKHLGFENIALSRHLTLEQLEQLKPLFREIGQAHPPVIQNYCPILPGTAQFDVAKDVVDSDKVQLSSLDNDERKEAIRKTIQTMQLAIEMEIPTVILRLGEVDTYNRSYLMTDLYNYGEREFEAFNKKVTEATEWRKRKEAKHYTAVLRSLDELNEAALRMELNIAIENRPQYFQIPNFDEVGLFFDEFYGSPMRYWHDIGHAALQEKLGLCWSQEWIKTYAEHLIGVTLHDLQELDPYHPPGTGDLDWDEIFAQIPDEVVKVIEIKQGDSEEIIQARELCESFTSNA